MRIWGSLAALILAMGMTVLLVLREVAGRDFGISWYWSLPFWGVIAVLWFLAGRPWFNAPGRTPR